MNNENNTEVINNEFDIFKNKIVGALSDYYGERAEISINVTIKNNDVEFTGVTVRKKDKNMGPTVYLEEFHELYMKGMTLGEIVKKIIGIVDNNENNIGFEVDDFCDFERARSHIVYRLINTDKNKKLLEDAPHFDYLDMSIVFCYAIEQDSACSIDSSMSGTIVLHNNHMELWHVTADELFEIAKDNTPRLYAPDVFHMSDIVDKSGFGSNICGNEEEYKAMPLYVLSNKRKHYGAGVILYDNLLEVFSISYQHNYYLIPSSVHEMIIVLDNGDIEPETLKAMIYQINRECVADTEVLSDSLYYYDNSKRKLGLV